MHQAKEVETAKWGRGRKLGAVSVGAGVERRRVGTLVVAHGGDERGGDPAGSKPRPRGRPQGSPPRSTPPPPLRGNHSHFVSLMRMRADKSAVGAINRPLLYNRIILLKVILLLCRRSFTIW